MWEQTVSRHPRLAALIWHGLFPAGLYLAAFWALTFPLAGSFFTAFWGDRRDGLQNAWNLWWVNLAVHRPDLYPSIWYTSLLHWPFGTSLVGHTLNPFNGYLALLFLPFLSLTPAYNAIILFAFVAAGLTAYWLCYALTRSYGAALLGGFMFTFSSFHFMHLSAGHMQVVSMEWIPLFLLCWYWLLARPGKLVAVAAAVSLWLVALCDYYFFLYCILAAAIMLCGHVITKKDVRILLRREYALPWTVFAAASLVLVGSLVFPLLISNARDPLTGAHDAAIYSLDLPGIVMPGQTWYFNGWTRAYWSTLDPSVKEGRAFLPLTAFILIAYLWAKRRRLEQGPRQQLRLWSAIAVFFFLLALGPVLHIAGVPVWDRWMPYTLLSYVLPFINLSGVPARMTVMVTLAACVLSAFGLRELWAQRRGRHLLAVALLALLLFQTWPAPIVTTTVKVPDYVTLLARLPDQGGVLNLIDTDKSIQLYYQTVHAKPITFGYISRVPMSVAQKDQQLSAVIDARDYAALSNVYHIRYVISSVDLPERGEQPGLRFDLLYDQKGVKLYRLSCTCEPEP